MEENKKIQVNNKILYTDTSPEFQPEGTSRFRLNAVPESNLGEQGNFSNELGNISKIKLPNNNIIIGNIPILEDRTVIFSVRQNNTNSEIGIYDEKIESYNTIINADCLNFKITNQVRGEFKIREGCNTNIYFTDFINPWRTIDLDNLNQYKDNLGNWDCNSFKLFKDFNITNIDMKVSNMGGNIKVGMYQFTYQYLDDDFNPQPWNTPTNPIPIVKDSLNSHFLLDGDITDTDTTKSIELTINNIDSRYSFIRIGLIASNLGRGFNSTAYILEELPIENNSVNYLFTGIDGNKTQSTDIDSFQYLPPEYFTGKDLTQIDNSLVLAYPKSRDINYIPFIRSALNIKSKYHIKDIFAEGTGEGSFGNRYPNSYFYNKSLMRDEVYSFGIVYIFKDGTETPAFHIPGRNENKYANGNIINSIDIEDENSLNFNLHNRPKVIEPYISGNFTQWDKVEYDAQNVFIRPNIINPNQVKNDKIERWKIFNTAIRTDYVEQQDNKGYYISKGELAYWESENYNYPDIKDCNGDYIYPDEFRGKKVRYHKMPDSTLEPHFYGYDNLTNPTAQAFAAIRPLNIEFFDINIPIEYINEIQGYRIVRTERNRFNSSVIDKGIMLESLVFADSNNNSIKAVMQTFPFNEHDFTLLGQTAPTDSKLEDYYVIDGDLNTMPNPDDFFRKNGTRYKSIHTPVSKIDKDLNGDFIKVERVMYGRIIDDITLYFFGKEDDYDRIYYNELDESYFKKGSNKIVFTVSGVRFNKSYLPIPDSSSDWQQILVNRPINNQSYIAANEVNVNNIPFYNNVQGETYAVELTTAFSDINYASEVKSSKVPSANSNNWNFTQNLKFPKTTKAFSEFVNVDTGCYYVGVKKYLPNQYNGIFQQVYISPTNISNSNSILYTNGDCFINDWAFKKYGEFFDNGKTSFEFPKKFKDQFSSTKYQTHRNLMRFWCESPINMELRNSEETVATSHFDSIGNPDDQLHKTKWYPLKNYQDGANMQDVLWAEDAWENGRFGTVRNYYAYNKDFGIENKTRFFFPLSINHDFCNECKVKFPHRLVNSNKAYQEERADNYRVFLPNNYRDIPGETGSINEVFVKNNKLFIHTTQSLWLQQVKPQEIKTDQATLYLGTGEFWEIPPSEIVTTKNGYAGCQHQYSTINTPFGYFWVSERERKIFLFNDKLNEISNRGLRNWFENNIPFNLDPFILKALNSTSDNVSNPNSVGFTTSYDKRHRRIILTKRDYIPLNKEGLIFDIFNKRWLYNEKIVIPYEEPSLFENKSWTISYHPDSEGFISWHSYLPYYMFNTQNNYYSFSTKFINEGFKHHSDNFQLFYQDKYPYILEYTVPYQSTNLIDTINYYNKVYNKVNNEWVEIPNTTYDNIIVYNDIQTSPYLDIIVSNPTPFQSVQNISNTNILATKAEEDWHISGFVDYTNNNNLSLFTQDWNQLQNNYFIDKVVNPNKLDLNQSVFELKQFRSKFINYRLSTNNSNNYKFISKYDITGYRTSDR